MTGSNHKHKRITSRRYPATQQQQHCFHRVTGFTVILNGYPQQERSRGIVFHCSWYIWSNNWGAMLIMNYKVRIKLLYFDVSVVQLFITLKSLHAPVACLSWTQCRFRCLLLFNLGITSNNQQLQHRSCVTRSFTGTDSQCFLQDAEHLFVVNLLQTSSW